MFLCDNEINKIYHLTPDTDSNTDAEANNARVDEKMRHDFFFRFIHMTIKCEPVCDRCTKYTGDSCCKYRQFSQLTGIIGHTARLRSYHFSLRKRKLSVIIVRTKSVITIMCLNPIQELVTSS